MELTPITETEFRKKLKGCGISYYSRLPSIEIKALLGFCPTRKAKRKIKISDESGFSKTYESANQAAKELQISNPSAIMYALYHEKPSIKRRSDKKIFNIREINYFFMFFLIFFFIFAIKIEMSTPKKNEITKESINLKKISLGNPEDKISGNFRYEITPVLYEKKPFQITVYGKIKFFTFNNKSFSVGVTIDKENKDFFKSIEKKISDLYGEKLHLIKTSHGNSRVYAKLFAKDGQIQTPIKILCNGEKKINDPLDYFGILLSGRIVMNIAKIYSGSCLSLACEAREVLFQ